MNIIFIDFLIRASKYGIGTYNYLYHNAIEKQSLACLYYIEILSEDILYTRVINVNQNFCHIKIPMPLELKQIEFISDDKLEFFSKTIFHIIKDYLDFKKENTIIHLNSYMGFYLALLIKKTFKYPLVTVYHFLHSQQSINNEEYRSYSAMNKVTMNLEKEAAKISDGIICMSDSVKELISKEFEICPEVIKKLSCGVNIDKFDLIENDQNYRKSLGYGKEEKVIVFCGRLDAQKGLNFLISAFKKLIDYDRKRRYRLLIIGEGLYDTYFKQCSDIWPMVSFTGYLTSERV
ncbi:MAG: glycosyltransferase, partial [Candidatus Odinarchaeota archaeon]